MLRILRWIKRGAKCVLSKLFPSLRQFYVLRRAEGRSRKSFPQIEREVSRAYSSNFSRSLNWDNPQAYTEKMCVSKVYAASEIKTRLTDKILVRDWVRERIGEQHLIPLLGVYDSFDEIDFDALPDQFVIKCNHDCGSVTVVKDKNSLDLSKLRKLYRFYLRRNFAWVSYELHYKDIKPRILIERYMSYVETAGTDYKFFCFDGKPYFCRILIDHRMSFYDMDWKLQPFTWKAYGFYDKEVPCPDRFGEMKELAAELSCGFDQVRVDLYLAGDNIYFGEMTFTTMAGMNVCNPDEWDFRLGSFWNFDTSIRARKLAEFHEQSRA